MQTNPLLYGLIGFFLGGLLVSMAVTFDKPKEIPMSEMTASLRDKKGDDYDGLFIGHMIEHHQAAVDMAKLSAQNAKHNEIKQLSIEIVAAQEKEISQMKKWQEDWGYTAPTAHSNIGH